MNIKRAVTLLSKFFAVNGDIFSSLSKPSTIAWAERVQAGQKKDVPAPCTYLLSQQEHAFLIGEIKGF